MARLLLVLIALLVSLAAGPAGAWRADVAGTPPDARPFALAVDGAGNVIAAGRTPSGAGDSDGMVAKLAANDGALRWQGIIAGTAGGNDNARALLVDGSGNAIVLGQVSNTGTGSDALVTKLRAQDGDPFWRTEIEGGRSGNDDIRAGTLVAGGDVIAVGVSPAPGEDDVVTLWRLAAATGAVLWRQTLPGAAGVAQRVVAASGRLVASHVPRGRGHHHRRGAHQDGDGTVDWVTALGGSGNAGDG
jgi:outer membrane protein assembly factor BamB